MDSGKQSGKGAGKTASNQKDLATALQQQLALAAMGIVPGLMDPSALNPTASSLSDSDIPRIMAMQAAGLPLIDHSAALAFRGVGGLSMPGMSPAMMPGASGGNDWLAIAQQAQLLAGLGGAMSPNMLSQLYGANPVRTSSIAQSGTASSSNKVFSNKVKLEVGGRGPTQPARVPSPLTYSQKNTSRPNSNASSRLTPSGILTPELSTTGKSSSKPCRAASASHSSTKDVKLTATPDNQHKNQASNADQIIQAEMFRQLEQHVLLQQLQLKQQQQQLEAALSVINQPNERQRGASNPRQQDTSQSEKLQQRLSESIYQQLLSTNPYLPGVAPAMNSYFGSQQIIEQMLGMGQPSSSKFSKNKSSSSGQLKVSSSSAILPPTAPQEPHEKSKNSRSTKPLPVPDLNKYFSTSLHGAEAAPFPFPGDPSSVLDLATIYSQLQSQGIDEAAISGKPTSSKNLSEKPAYFNASKELEKSIAKPKEESLNVSNDVTAHRRKQANPISINATSDGVVKACETVSGQTQEVSSSRMTSITNDVMHPLKKSSGLKKQDAPLSLVRSKDAFTLSNENAKPIKVESNDCGNSASNIQGSVKEKMPKMKQTNDKMSQNSESLNEKEILFALQAFAKMTSKTDSTAALEEMNNLLLTAHSGMLNSSENLNLNKINELLTATVAAEMEKLQTQQANLTREIENLSKNDSRNLSSSVFRKQVLTAGKSGVDSHAVDYKVPRKRRRVISDEDEVMEPLRQGWDREVKFRRVGNQIRGEVFYHTPGGRKLRTYPEVLKYLDDHGISSLKRDNFSFSSKLKIGTFYEQKGESKVWTKIPDSELDRHLGIDDCVDDSSHNASASDDNTPYVSRRKRNARSIVRNPSISQAIEENLKKENETMKQEIKQREQRKEEVRLQREIKERQLLEDRRKMEAARQLAKYQEAVRKEKEKEERRRHLMFIRTLETKRRAEERDRRREEIKNERIFIREKKMEQRRLAMKLAREMKMPVEDMCLTNHQPLPKMQCLQGTVSAGKKTVASPQLSGTATADVLMVLEFLYTFKNAIFIDESIIPTFEQLQRGLLNDPEHVGSLVQLTMALLHQCLCDPGVPAAGPWLHCLIGVKVIDLDVSKENYSEILRLFLWGRNGQKNEITDLLETEPFPSLTADQKAGILASMVNELICSKPVCDEIDNHLENLATLRRDKWIVEGKIRQARIEHANDGSDVATSSPAKSRSKIKNHSEDDNDEKVEKEDACKDDDSTTSDSKSDNKPTCRSDTMIERKMKRLTKEHQSFNDRLFSCAKPLRAFELGQDRYRRRYWVLSNLGGVYVEGLESGSWFDGNEFEDPKQKKKDLEKNAKDDPASSLCPGFEGNSTMTDTSNISCASQKEENFQPEVVSFKSDEKNVVSVKRQLDLDNDVFYPSGKKTHTEKETSPTVTTTSATLVSRIESPNVSLGASQLIIPCSSNSILVPDSIRTFTQDTPSSDASTPLPSLANVDLKSNDFEKADILPNTSITSDSTSFALKNNQTSSLENQAYSSCSSPEATLFSPAVILKSTSNTTPSTANTETISSEKFASKLGTSDVEMNLKTPSKSEMSLQREQSVEIVGASKSNPVVNTISVSQHTKLSIKEKNNPKIVEDQVEAAARAIAAKAVASTSHILYPQSRTTKACSESIPISSSSENVSSTHTSVIGATSMPNSSNNQTLPVTITTSSDIVPGISKHMSKALEYLGVDTHNLSQEQMQVLSMMRNIEESKDLSTTSTFSIADVTATTTKNKESLQINPKNQINSDQEVPMDLSKPSVISTSASGPSSPTMSSTSSMTSVTIPVFPSVKSESPSFDFPYYCQRSPSLYGGFPSMTPFHSAVKSEMNRSNCEVAGYVDIKSNNVSKQPAPTPEEMKRGWWRVSSAEEFDELCNSLHCRGIREKFLQRAATKHRKYCLQAIEQADSPEFQFAGFVNKVDGDEEEIKRKNVDDNSSDQTETFFDEEQLEDGNETAFLIELELLRQIDELVEKCKLAGVLYENTGKSLTSSHRHCDLMHIPYRPDVTGEEFRCDLSNPVLHDPRSALGVAAELLKNLEKSLMRSYLKPPLVRKGGASECNSLSSLTETGDAINNEKRPRVVEWKRSQDVASGLKTWRSAIATATSAAQLSICVAMLNQSINWNRAPKLSSKLDASPRGKKKKVEKSGRGKSPGSSSGRKRKSTKVAVENEVDSEQTQIDDVDEISRDSKLSDTKSSGHPDPVNRPKDNSMLQSDDEKMLILQDDDDTKANAEAWESEKDTFDNHDMSEDNQGNDDEKSSEGSEEKKKRKKNSDKRKRKKTLLGACKEILRILQTHEMATWFLFPVDLKVVPNYRKIIKKPMDFKTIESRLRRKKYKFASEFADDVRTVFDNCKIFNEDDSPIGRAGHALRSLFDGRWLQLQDSMNIEEPIG